tara:strand:- start:313 stop:501 length:189 start_codon:yes stop_codon:yes gene_type:complete
METQYIELSEGQINNLLIGESIVDLIRVKGEMVRVHIMGLPNEFYHEPITDEKYDQMKDDNI